MDATQRDGVSDEGPSARGGSTVYAVIPVFNRLDRTLRCIECLKAQTFQPIRIVVSDGGSTDGTPAAIAERHPEIVVVTSPTIVWWAGSMRIGIDWALADSSRDDDFVMMVNNDTEFEPAYVETLVKEARSHNVAIGGIVVDERNPKNILDAGVQFDWERYAFTGRRAWPEPPFDPVQPTDVLPGRGTVIPIGAIRRAGNVDDATFPHYLADYEFTYRLRTRGGIGLAVSFDAVIKTEPPVARQKAVRHPLGETWHQFRQRFAKSSKSNVLVHWRFVSRHAPPEIKARLRKRLMFGMVRSSMMPAFDWLTNLPPSRVAIYAVRRILRFARAVRRALIGPYLIHASDIEHFRMNLIEMEREDIINRTNSPAYWRTLRSRSYLRTDYPQAVPLYWRICNPGRKIARYVDFHMLVPRLEAKIFGWMGLGDRLELELFRHSITVAKQTGNEVVLRLAQGSARQGMSSSDMDNQLDWSAVRRLKDRLLLRMPWRTSELEGYRTSGRAIVIDLGVISRLRLPLDELLDEGVIKPSVSVTDAYVLLSSRDRRSPTQKAT